MTDRPTSLSDSGQKLTPIGGLGEGEEGGGGDSDIMTCSSIEQNDNEQCSKEKAKMNKYFEKKTEKNVLIKMFTSNWYERNQQYCKLFVEKGLTNEDEEFLTSYSCAFHKEILLQGRMYISQGHIGFYSKIPLIGTAHLAIPFEEVREITRQRAAFVFPNSIQVETASGGKFFFASFLNREKSLSVLQKAFLKTKEGHPLTATELYEFLKNDISDDTTTPSTPASTHFESNGCDKNSNKMTILKQRTKRGSSKKNGSKTEKDDISQGSSQGSECGIYENGCHNDNTSNMSTEETFDIKCPHREDEHPNWPLLDAVFPVSIDEIYQLLFTENTFSDKFNTELKNRDYASSAWVLDHNNQETRTCTYTISLNDSIAPMTCIVNEKQIFTHYPNKGDGICIFKETENSGVPYCDSFVVVCQYCISKTSRTSCRVKVTCGINYKKSVWSIIRGYIEKGTQKGLTAHYSLLEKMLMEECKVISESRISPTNSIESTSISNQIEHEDDRLVAGRENGSKKSENGEISKEGISRITIPQNRQKEYNRDGIISTGYQSHSNDYSMYLWAIISLLFVFLCSNFYMVYNTRYTDRSVQNDQTITDMLHNMQIQMDLMRDQLKALESKNK